MEQRLQRLERQRKHNYVFTNNGVAKQAKFITTVEDWVQDELQVKLEAEIGHLPRSLKDVISAGEKILSDRRHLLKIADRYGWGAVTEFTEVELARNEIEEKKLKKIMKASELKKAKARESKFKGRRWPYFQTTGGYRAVSPDNRYVSCVVKAAHAKLTPGGGRNKSCASRARSQVTCRRTAGAGENRPREAAERVTEKEVEEEEDEEADREGMRGARKGYFINGPLIRNNKIISNDTFASEFLSLEKLDSLDGITGEVNIEHEYSEYLKGNAVDITEQHDKVVDALKGKVSVWAKFGAGKMVQNIVKGGLRLNFIGKLPGPYMERNNKSFRDNEIFGVEQVLKLLENRVIEEVDFNDILCVNPLSIAANKKGKQRLCLDLSRWVNDSCVAKKFRIESVSEFMRVVKQGSWAFFYDLKSAYHHVAIIEKHRKFLGLSVKINGKERYFRFTAMPFGYNDASRILTKIMRTPLSKWRASGIPSYIHIDDGLGFMGSKKEAEKAAKVVRSDLKELGLVLSEEKCQWDPVQCFEWCGFLWNLAEFRVEVPSDKLARIKEMARELVDSNIVSARQTAAFTGLVIACAPAIGRSARFFTRITVAWCQSLVDENGWGAQGEMPKWVKEEVSFWITRLEEFSGQPIRHSASILEYYVCSDSGKYQIGGTVSRKGAEKKEEISGNIE